MGEHGRSAARFPYQFSQSDFWSDEIGFDSVARLWQQVSRSRRSVKQDTLADECDRRNASGCFNGSSPPCVTAPAALSRRDIVPSTVGARHHSRRRLLDASARCEIADVTQVSSTSGGMVPRRVELVQYSAPFPAPPAHQVASSAPTKPNVRRQLVQLNSGANAFRAYGCRFPGVPAGLAANNISRSKRPGGEALRDPSGRLFGMTTNSDGSLRPSTLSTARPAVFRLAADLPSLGAIESTRREDDLTRLLGSCSRFRQRRSPA